MTKRRVKVLSHPPISYNFEGVYSEEHDGIDTKLDEVLLKRVERLLNLPTNHYRDHSQWKLLAYSNIMLQLTMMERIIAKSQRSYTDACGGLGYYNNPSK